MRSRFREVVFALVPLALVLVLAGAAAEWWLRGRHADARAAIQAKAQGREPCTQASSDPRRIYEGAPGKCGQNGLGFRDRAHAPEKAQGVFRVALIGDSVAHGQGVLAEEALGRVLERQLAAQGTAAEVLVFATTGYSTYQQLALLDVAFRYAPDLVLWTYVLNDPADPLIDNANGELGVYWHAPASFALDALRQLWRRAVANLAGRNCPNEWHRRLHCAHRDEIAAHFATIAAAGKARGVPLMLVLLPLVRQEGWAPYPYADIHADLRMLAQDNGMPVIDATSAFANARVDEIALPDPGGGIDPWHPNARGHARIGAYLARELEARGATSGQ